MAPTAATALAVCIDKRFGLRLRQIERDVIARGIFTSVPDLKRKLDTSRRITPESIVTGH